MGAGQRGQAESVAQRAGISNALSSYRCEARPFKQAQQRAGTEQLQVFDVDDGRSQAEQTIQRRAPVVHHHGGSPAILEQPVRGVGE